MRAALSKLIARGAAQRVARGLYTKPDLGRLDTETPPMPISASPL